KLARQGFVRARIDGVLRSLDEDIPLDRRKNHTIEVMVDRLLVKPGIQQRLEASIETATKLANGLVVIAIVNGEDRLYSLKPARPRGGRARPPAGAEIVLVQQPLRRLRAMPRSGEPVDGGSRQDHRRSGQAAARRSAGGRSRTNLDDEMGAGELGPQAPDPPH